ncbi:DNA-directed RNA polymerase subunit beta'' [Trichinella pseudospiralis]
MFVLQTHHIMFIKFRYAHCRAFQKASIFSATQQCQNIGEASSVMFTVKKIRVRVVVGHLPCQMEMDTAFEGELVKLKGSCLVNVQYENIYHTLTLIVTKGHCPNLLELNWILFSSGYVPVGTKMLSEMSKDCLPMRPFFATSRLQRKKFQLRFIQRRYPRPKELMHKLIKKH